MKILTLAQRYEILLKAIHLNKSIPQQFSARHLVTRCKGLALKDAANMELKIAIVALVGVDLSIKALGKLLSEVIHGRRFGDYQLEGHRTKEGAGYSCWQFTLLYFGAPVPEPVKPEPKPMTLDSLVADQEAADRQARDQQSRLEKAENREVLDELARKNAEQRRAMKSREPYPGFVEENARAYRETEARKPLKWKLGERFSGPMGDGVWAGTAENKKGHLDNGRVIDVVENAPPDTRPGGDMLRWYEEQSYLAMMRGDTRSMEQIAASSRVWYSPMGMNKVGSAMPINRHGNFYADNVSESDALDRKFRGY